MKLQRAKEKWKRKKVALKRFDCHTDRNFALDSKSGGDQSCTLFSQNFEKAVFLHPACSAGRAVSAVQRVQSALLKNLQRLSREPVDGNVEEIQFLGFFWSRLLKLLKQKSCIFAVTQSYFFC